MATPNAESTGSRAAPVVPTFAKYRERDAYPWREASLHPIHGWPYTRTRMAWMVRECVESIELLDRLGSPLSIFWTQGIVASNPRRERRG